MALHTQTWTCTIHVLHTHCSYICTLHMYATCHVLYMYPTDTCVLYMTQHVVHIICTLHGMYYACTLQTYSTWHDMYPTCTLCIHMHVPNTCKLHDDTGTLALNKGKRIYYTEYCKGRLVLKPLKISTCRHRVRFSLPGCWEGR